MQEDQDQRVLRVGVSELLEHREELGVQRLSGLRPRQGGGERLQA